ncbi:MAG: SIS domain-containing protein [Dehalococcoidia bacterium]|nr:SIS domain-containing protein [Dehalococcoidia bacterium]
MSSDFARSTVLDAPVGTGAVVDDEPRLPALEQADPSGLWRRLVEFPQQAAHAWQMGTRWTGIDHATDVRRVIVVGMGGSAIGGQLAGQIVQHRAPVAVQVVRDSDIPATDEHTLIVVASFSGETEEVLSALPRIATQPGAKMVITRGGTLGREAAALDIPALIYSYEGEPRSALGYGALLLLGVLRRVGAFPATDAEVERALAEVGASCLRYHPDADPETNPTHSLARQLRDRIPVVMADASLEAAAARWQTQLNENSKRWAFPGTLPEALHNLVEAVGARGAGSDVDGYPFHVVLLEDQTRPNRARARIDALQELLSDSGIEWTRVALRGSSHLSILLQACLAGDWVSYYLAVDEGINPSPVPFITDMKQRVAQMGAGYPSERRLSSLLSSRSTR